MHIVVGAVWFWANGWFLASLSDLTGWDQVLLGLVAVILIAIAFVGGKLWSRFTSRREPRRQEELMFQIEKSLADFFAHEKSKLVEEKATLEREVKQLSERVEEYRKRAAGVSGRGAKDAKAELMMNLLVENEGLQEKLFQEHVRQKEERDRHLRSELSALSYQRVLLSRLLEHDNVRDAVVEVLGDDQELQRLKAHTPQLGPASTPVEPDVSTPRSPADEPLEKAEGS